MPKYKTKFDSNRWGFQKRFLLALLLLLAGRILIHNFTGSDIVPAQASVDRSDLNGDGYVDLEDLKIFSIKKLKKSWEAVEWCPWLERYGGKYDRQYAVLMDFIWEWFDCGGATDPNDPNVPGEDPLAVVHANSYPTRLTFGPNGNLYVSDVKIGSVFIYDPNLVLLGELKGLGKPIGIAVDAAGNMYVGCDDKDSIEIYDPNGTKKATWAQGRTKIPTDMDFDRDGNLYIADVQSRVVWVYDSDGKALSNIGNGELHTPISVDIAYRDDGTGGEIGELYVADQGTSLIRVYDLQGFLVRLYGGEVTKSMMGGGYKWEGKFVKIQSIAIDPNDTVHAADIYLNKIQILNSQSGSFISAYSGFGTAPGQINLPMDIAINDLGQVIVANSENGRVEIIYSP